MAHGTRKAVVLLSGGLDSATTLAIARSEGFSCYAISFRYGQRHGVELTHAAWQAGQQGVAQHLVVDIAPGVLAGSALTDPELAVPKHQSADDIGREIPITYVPARNTLFLSYALGWAEVLGAFDLFAGVNALDYSGYPDCRPEYVDAFEKMANLALKSTTEGAGRLRIHVPLIQWTKGEIIRQGLALGDDYGKTSSCYDPSDEGWACGHCDSCLLRRKGFAENQISDPARYQERAE